MHYRRLLRSDSIAPPARPPHIWYIGKEGLVHQETERRSSINELGVELLQWLSED